MTPKLMVAALRQGETGAQILEILDAITSVDNEREQVIAVMNPATNYVATAVPTLEEIAF